MSTNRPTRLLACLDLDDTARVTWAAATALLTNPNAGLSVLHVVRASDRDVRKDADAASRAVADGHQRLQHLLTSELGTPDNPLLARIELYVGIGDPAEEIVQLATDLEADVIVVGTNERRGLARIALGSVSTEVFRRARCSVLVARTPDWTAAEKTPAIEPPLAEGQSPMMRTMPPVRYRSVPFSTYNANLFPTGIPRKQVR